MNAQTTIVLRWIGRTGNAEFFVAAEPGDAFRDRVLTYFRPGHRAGSPAARLIDVALAEVDWTALRMEISPPATGCCNERSES